MNKKNKKTIINRGPRVTANETQNIIDNIPALKGLFTRLHEKFELDRDIKERERKKREEGNYSQNGDNDDDENVLYDADADHTTGLLYLSKGFV